MRRALLRGAPAALGTTLAWSVILGVLGLVGLAVVVPRLAGATPYVVLTGSMRPGMPPGTLVVVRPVSPDRIGVGAVVTYQLRSGEPTVVTHRVVAQGTDSVGRIVFRTQGDANPVPDAGWVRPVQIRGTRWFSVPYVGYATSLVTDAERSAATVLVVGLLLGYAGWMFAGAARDRWRRGSAVTS